MPFCLADCHFGLSFLIISECTPLVWIEMDTSVDTNLCPIMWYSKVDMAPVCNQFGLLDFAF